MADTLKSVYNKDFLLHFSGLLRDAYKSFDTDAFISEVMDSSWDKLELKARMRHISLTLGNYLPKRYKEAIAILMNIDEHCVGFPYLIFPDFVEVYGHSDEHWSLSMEALERFTQRSSAEFAVRSFMLRDPARMMEQMMIWSTHPNEHVRRLASEGSRPRLPWAQSLPMFKQDPAPVLQLLEQLKEDPSLYVRKSVANNLNDIAKDHPSVVVDTAIRWKGVHPHTDWIVRHGCRSLIRKAHPVIMTLFGYGDTDDAEPIMTSTTIAIEPQRVSIGGTSELRYELRVREGEPVRIRIEYGIYFVKARGQTSRKSFLLSDKTVPGGAIVQAIRTHRWSDLTTRRHYPGEHRIALLVNGQEVAYTSITLDTE